MVRNSKFWGPGPWTYSHNHCKNTSVLGGTVLKDVRTQNRPTFIFFKLLLQLDKEQIVSEKQKRGITVLVSEIKRVGNVVFLEALVMQGGIRFLATRNKISFVEDSR